jgi:hypothetical protein
MTVSRKTAALTGIIIAAIAIPVGIYTISPLFVNTEVNEPIPNKSINPTPSEELEKFMAMTEEQRLEKGQKMSPEEKDMIMKASAETNGDLVNENMTEAMDGQQTILVGTFVGVNDGIHNAQGSAKVIPLVEDSSTRVLRLENFKATNGPDLYVYLATDKSASDFVNLGRLKGNIGNQNYEIPEGTDLSRYDTALIWCRAFSVLFGSAELKSK